MLNHVLCIVSTGLYGVKLVSSLRKIYFRIVVFDILMMPTMKIILIQDVTPFSLAKSYLPTLKFKTVRSSEYFITFHCTTFENKIIFCSEVSYRRQVLGIL
jgi:hypothetical protein